MSAGRGLTPSADDAPEDSAVNVAAGDVKGVGVCAEPTQAEGVAEEAPMEPTHRGELKLRRISPSESLIHDLDYPLDDSRSVIARIFDTDDDLIEVVWLRGISLPSQYLCVDDVLDDFRRHREAGLRSRRPEEIPHLPPFSGRTLG
ncbi:hypothetical protein GCM10027024_17650 [Microbacterium insulae]